MTGHQINSLVGDLVAMAQAMERLPQVEAELYTKGNEVVDWQRRYDIIAQDLEQSRSYAASLEAKVHDAEVARDDAELRFLGIEETAHMVRRVLNDIAASAQNQAAQITHVIEPPKPQPEPQPEPMVEPGDGSMYELVREQGQGEPIAGNGNGDPQGQSEPGPIAQEVSSVTGNSAQSPIAPLENVSLSVTTEHSSASPSPGPYYGRRYIDYPGWVSREDWLAGGGTNEDYDWRETDGTH